MKKLAGLILACALALAAWAQVVAPGAPMVSISTVAAAGNGTVTSASVVTANGVSATVATATTTPAFTFTLGVITPVSVATMGTGGAGFVDFPAQSSDPSAPASSHIRIFANASNKFAWIGASGFVRNFDGTLTASRTYTLPDFSGSVLVNAGTGTFTSGGNTTFIGAFTGSYTLTGNTNVTFPTSGTLATVGGTEVPLTFSTGLTRTVNTVTVNTSQNIATLSNLTGNGSVQTTGGTGALSVVTNTGTGNNVMSASPTLTGTIVLGNASITAAAVTNLNSITAEAATGFGLNAGTGNTSVTLTANGTGVFQANSNSSGKLVYNNGTIGTGFDGLWLLPTATTVTSSNYLFYRSSTSVGFQGPSGGQAYMGIAGGTTSITAVTSGNLLVKGLGTDGGSNKAIQIPGTNVLNLGATANGTIGVTADTTSGVLTLTPPSVGSINLAGNSTVTGALTQTGKTTTYNNVATAGWGQPSIYGAARSTAQTAAVASVATYTVGASDGSFEVSANINVTTATLHSFSATCAYTDETNTSRVLTMPFVQLGGITLVGTITNATGSGPYEGVPLHIRAKASTAITIATSGTFTTVTYNVEGVIKQML